MPILSERAAERDAGFLQESSTTSAGRLLIHERLHLSLLPRLYSGFADMGRKQQCESIMLDSLEPGAYPTRCRASVSNSMAPAFACNLVTLSSTSRVSQCLSELHRSDQPVTARPAVPRCKTGSTHLTERAYGQMQVCHYLPIGYTSGSRPHSAPRRCSWFGKSSAARRIDLDLDTPLCDCAFPATVAGSHCTTFLSVSTMRQVSPKPLELLVVCCPLCHRL